jgi:hypothetical protein
MQNQFYFDIPVSDAQKKYTKDLVIHSLKHHPVANIWDAQKKDKTEALRLTGTLGEVVFADLYGLPRPVRSFGHIEGQDYGKDFEITANGILMNIDVKTMHRKSSVFYENYVLNIPARNIKREDSITDYYYCISLHENKRQETIASIIGYLKKKDVVDGKIGILYKKDTKRIRKDGTSFTFFEDTYEVFFKDIKSPLINQRIRNIEGFSLKKLKN